MPYVEVRLSEVGERALMHELDSVPAAEGAQRRLVHYDENAAAMSQSRHAPATRRRMERSYEH